MSKATESVFPGIKRALSKSCGAFQTVFPGIKQPGIQACAALFLLFSTQTTLAATSWQTVAPGLSYTVIDVQNKAGIGKVHAFLVDLKQNRLELALARTAGAQFASVQNITERNHGLVGINGGFFNNQMQSLGLRINNGKKLSNYKPISWWGTFLTEKQRANILPPRKIPSKTAEFALQCGPRLLVNGRIPKKLSPGLDNRSALGIRSDNKVVIVATENLTLSTQNLAEIMSKSTAENGLDCRDAINLDGGSSTQLYSQVEDFSVSVPSFMPVADIILVLPR